MKARKYFTEERQQGEGSASPSLAEQIDLFFNPGVSSSVVYASLSWCRTALIHTVNRCTHFLHVAHLPSLHIFQIWAKCQQKRRQQNGTSFVEFFW